MTNILSGMMMVICLQKMIYDIEYIFRKHEILTIKECSRDIKDQCGNYLQFRPIQI